MTTAIAAFAVLAAAAFQAGAQPISISPGTMSRTGATDERFQSYNIEMIEVTGGRFWKPYATGKSEAPAAAPANPADLYEYRPPVDLSKARLRNLAAALGPAYARVSGLWANTVYFHDSDAPAPQQPPAGFNGVLTRAEWKGVIDFSRAADAKIVTSFAFGAGTRDANGAWTSDQARRFVAYTKAAGGSIAAAEFINEPNFGAQGGAPKGYDAAAFARDIEAFRRFFREASPGSLFLGPGSVGEGGVLDNAPAPGRLKTEDLLKATGPIFDAFSYHIYPAISQRCSGGMPAIGTTAAAALSRDWLFRPDKIHAFYANLRDRFEPGKPLWVTETGDAACGGNPWAATFRDSFRYLNQHARLAQQGVQVVAHNTLAASDYGLLDEKTLDPRPNYWAALLWGRLMGPIVLSAGPAAENDLYIYAHCQRGRPGGVTVLAINTGSAARELEAPVAGQGYTLTARDLDSRVVQLNGHDLQATAEGKLPGIAGVSARPGRLPLPPTSITFVTFPDAANKACQ
jgi:hypothetical protein